MSRGLKTTLIVLGIILVLLFIVYSQVKGSYNNMVSLRENTQKSWSNVETVLQRRLDLIPNLVATVKGYAKHEKETLTAVTEARAKVAGAGTIPEKIQANGALTSALSRLMVVVERYPELKANENFNKLQFELAGTENRINVARTRYNQSVETYNKTIKSFPANVLAGMFGFSPADYFKADSSAKTAPKVKFD